MKILRIGEGVEIFRCSKKIDFSFLYIIFVLLCHEAQSQTAPAQPAEDVARNWTDLNGRTFKGVLTDISDESVFTIKNEMGRPFRIPARKFKKEDRDFAAQWIMQQPDDRIHTRFKPSIEIAKNSKNQTGFTTLYTSGNTNYGWYKNGKDHDHWYSLVIPLCYQDVKLVGVLFEDYHRDKLREEIDDPSARKRGTKVIPKIGAVNSVYWELGEILTKLSRIYSGEKAFEDAQAKEANQILNQLSGLAVLDEKFLENVFDRDQETVYAGKPWCPYTIGKDHPILVTKIEAIQDLHRHYVNSSLSDKAFRSKASHEIMEATDLVETWLDPFGLWVCQLEAVDISGKRANYNHRYLSIESQLPPQDVVVSKLIRKP